MKTDIGMDLLARISSGELRAGDRLPSERELAKAYGCSLWAAHSALAELQKQGFLERRGALGSFLKETLSLHEVRRQRNAGSSRVQLVLAKGLYRERLPVDQMIKQLERRLEEAKLELLYGDLPTTAAGLEEFLAASQRDELKALVLVPDYPEWRLLWACAPLLDAFAGNLICFNRGLGNPADLACHSLSVDVRYEGRLAAEYLLSRGSRELAFFRADVQDSWWLAERLAGVRHILKAAGRKTELQEWPCASGRWDFPEVAEYLRANGKKTGIIAANDEAAAMLIDYLCTLELLPGRDFSLVSYDNAAPFRKYGLSSVEPSLDQAGEILADAILAGEIPAASHVHLHYRLSSRMIERTSVIPQRR